jgi:hypothetical protein
VLPHTVPVLLTAAEAVTAQATEDTGRSSPVQTRHRVAQATGNGPMLPALPKRSLSSAEEAVLQQQEEAVLRQLRMFVAACLSN